MQQHRQSLFKLSMVFVRWRQRLSTHSNNIAQHTATVNTILLIDAYSAQMPVMLSGVHHGWTRISHDKNSYSWYYMVRYGWTWLIMGTRNQSSAPMCRQSQQTAAEKGYPIRGKLRPFNLIKVADTFSSFFIGFRVQPWLALYGI